MQSLLSNHQLTMSIVSTYHVSDGEDVSMKDLSLISPNTDKRKKLWDVTAFFEIDGNKIIKSLKVCELHTILGVEYLDGRSRSRHIIVNTVTGQKAYLHKSQHCVIIVPVYNPWDVLQCIYDNCGIITYKCRSYVSDASMIDLFKDTDKTTVVNVDPLDSFDCIRDNPIIHSEYCKYLDPTYIDMFFKISKHMSCNVGKVVSVHDNVQIHEIVFPKSYKLRDHFYIATKNGHSVLLRVRGTQKNTFWSHVDNFDTMIQRIKRGNMDDYPHCYKLHGLTHVPSSQLEHLFQKKQKVS